MRALLGICLIATLTACTEHEPDVLPEPLALEALRATSFETSLSYERPLEEGMSFTAYLLSYPYAGLKLYAMIAVPKSTAPEAGFPVVIANHGYVPDPTRYGITAEGVDSRPGDYYRSVPELYAARGFLVVIPDYRGHNSSEGLEYILEQQLPGYFAEDVVAMMSVLAEIESADLDNVFMWSHSMGGGVSMRALLATDIVKASSFWATTNVDDLQGYFADLDGPVMIQHAAGDTSTEHSNSERLAGALEAIGHPHVYVSYDSDDHYFEGEMRERAADRDAEFFRAQMQ